MEKDLKKIFELSELESFDSKAFEGDTEVPQDVCNFVLTLSLVFNDLKDLLYANEYIQTIKPHGDFKINREWGNYGGINNHFKRSIIGYVHELMNLVKANQKTIEHPFFQTIINKLDTTHQEAWLSLVDSSFEKPTSTQIGKYLLYIRNQVVFHYEPKPIFLGYKEFFSSGVKASQRAYISRGPNMAKTRYYFADAAINGCFDRYKVNYEGEDIFLDSMLILDKLNFALMDIIEKFLIRRGYIFREVHEDK
jgi:hypothetical protein